MNVDKATKDLTQSVIDGKVWEDFCDQLKQAGQQILRPETPADAFNRAEGFRYLTRLIRSALEVHVEFNDANFPVLFLPSHETIKIGADSPDNLYYKAVLDGTKEYRITGTRGSVNYLGFATKSGDYATTGEMLPTGFIDSNQLQLNADNSFEIILSQKQQSKNWLPMTADTNTLIIRQTFLDRKKEQKAELTIARLDEGAAPLPLKAEDLARNLANAASFVQGTARLFADWAQGFLAMPNQLPPADQAYCQSIGGDPTIFYYHGYWQLNEDEALVIDVPRIPQCETWNFQLDNYWMESLDYRYHHIHVNKQSAHYAPDGSVRIIVAHHDPGLPNWVETAGHHSGTNCFRWISSEEQVHPQTRVVKFSELAALVA